MMTVVVGVEKCRVWFGADEEVGGKGWKTMSAEGFVIERLSWPNKSCRVVVFAGKSLLEDWRKMSYWRRPPSAPHFYKHGLPHSSNKLRHRAGSPFTTSLHDVCAVILATCVWRRCAHCRLNRAVHHIKNHVFECSHVSWSKTCSVRISVIPVFLYGSEP